MDRYQYPAALTYSSWPTSSPSTWTPDLRAYYPHPQEYPPFPQVYAPPPSPDMVATDLPPHQLDHIFSTRVLPHLLRQGPPLSFQHPTVLIMVGQPGAGKSATERPVATALGHPNAISIDPDDFNALHPMYDTLASRDEISALDSVKKSASKLWNMAINHARGCRNDIIIPMVPDPRNVERLADWRGAGYRIEMVFIAVDDVRSKQGVLSRLLKSRARQGFGRPADPDMKNHIYNGILDLADLADQGHVDGVHVVQRGGNIVGHWDLTMSHPPVPTRDVITKERNRPWSHAEAAAFAAMQKDIKNLIGFGRSEDRKLARYIEDQSLFKMPSHVAHAAHAHHGMPDTTGYHTAYIPSPRPTTHGAHVPHHAGVPRWTAMAR